MLFSAHPNIHYRTIKKAETVSENSLRLFGNFDKKLTNRLSVFMEKGHIFQKV